MFSGYNWKQTSRSIRSLLNKAWSDLSAERKGLFAILGWIALPSVSDETTSDVLLNNIRGYGFAYADDMNRREKSVWEFCRKQVIVFVHFQDNHIGASLSIWPCAFLMTSVLAGSWLPNSQFSTPKPFSTRTAFRLPLPAQVPLTVSQRSFFVPVL